MESSGPGVWILTSKMELQDGFRRFLELDKTMYCQRKYLKMHKGQPKLSKSQKYYNSGFKTWITSAKEWRTCQSGFEIWLTSLQWSCKSGFKPQTTTMTCELGFNLELFALNFLIFILACAYLSHNVQGNPNKALIWSVVNQGIFRCYFWQTRQF